MKYIRHRDLGLIVFEQRNRHDLVAELLPGGPEAIESAGFVFCGRPEALMALGDSGTLRKACAPGDPERMRAAFNAFQEDVPERRR